MTPRRIIAAALAFAAAVTLTASPQAAPYRAPRTADGQPDLQGFWTTLSATSLQRPAGAPLTFATRAQEQAYESNLMAQIARGEASGLGQGAAEWHPAYGMARLDGKLRTSWLVSPADGRLPYRPEALKRFQALMAAAAESPANPEDRPPTDRCLLAGFASATPPMMNPAVAGGKQIVQTATEVAILSEMNHDLRIIRLAGSLGREKGRKARQAAPAHLPPSVRVWLGDSVGHWEGETLVVETTNFHDQETFRGPVYMISAAARVTERFTRTARDEIRYAFEVDDPATYTAPWRGEMPLHPDKGPIFEFACHEGNYSMPLMLQIARAAEKGR
ncbi:hypothetical protein [Phenylobacterium sp.]|jgi:hypothetical protein|uniref:hypothetical protein n=1 Tax=Phenylobacterium sp. TaxID=1871053 RepID=UPI002E3653DE|nr:hypothetical protein [Phenylobacterium sp.]HEX3366397.1 hypothetical protein [Phenylobacterium sp.]